MYITVVILICLLSTLITSMLKYIIVCTGFFFASSLSPQPIEKAF